MNSAPEAPRILIAASGTGGHLMPALYIAQAIKAKAPNADIEFIGSGRPLEETVLGKAGFKRSVVDIVGLKKRGILGALQFLGKIPALWQSGRQNRFRFVPPGKKEYWAQRWNA
jgi:UDP-N-acetylglucosamine--N-acetylmuramyl-(pentapeptide) pyrophosphoryl-undecaprenol N-acetylglucosamine transferase